MDNNYQISINQLADFYKGTDAKKKRIVKQQKTPNTFRIAYYQLAKARIKKTLQLHGELGPVLAGISELKNRKPEKKRQISDKKVSIEALERFVKMKLPKLLTGTNYQIIKPLKKKSFYLNGVEIIVSPDVIIKIVSEGKTYIGGFKLHVSKSNVFSSEQQSIIASSLYKFLETQIATDEDIVLPELCLSLDIFGDGYVATSSNLDYTINNIEKMCDEIKLFWNNVA
ncbi:hypothetical protein LNI98_11655 [Tenacibaculum dicentrarchi]|nr:hypothetical protein [Tenacibaculum dicentrarchi]